VSPLVEGGTLLGRFQGALAADAEETDGVIYWRHQVFPADWLTDGFGGKRTASCRPVCGAPPAPKLGAWMARIPPLQSEVVQKDCQARNLNREDTMDHGRWKKLIKVG